MARATKKVIRIDPIDMQSLEFYIEGTAPLGVHRFSNKAQTEIEETQAAGSTAKSRKNRDARDLEAEFENSKYISEENWLGVNAACFRNGMISVCKATGFVMTRAKLALFIEADGRDKYDGTPLVRIYGEPQMWKTMVRLSSGSFDVRARPKWPFWKMRVRVRYDRGIFTESDVTNLMVRLGVQAGICEGRPDSSASPGIAMGTFRLIDDIPELEQVNVPVGVGELVGA